MQNPLSIWTASLLKPSRTTYEAIYNTEGARTRIALLWIIFSSLLSTVISLIGKALLPYHPLNQIAGQQNSGTLTTEQSQRIIESLQWMTSPWIWFFAGPFFFLVMVGISHFMAIVLGGRGHFRPYSYLVASIQAPIAILVALLSWIPLLGQCLTTIISLGMYVYFVIATQAAYKFGIGKAIVAALTPLVISIFFFMCFMGFAIMTAMR